MNQTLKRREILRGKSFYREIIKQGLPIRGNAIKATISEISPISNNSGKISYVVGITSHRSIKHAVDRNRIKRWIREAYRIHKNLLGVGTIKRERPLGIIFSCYRQPDIPHRLSFPAIENDMKNILHHLSTLQL